jgi:hypothetical protein
MHRKKFLSIVGILGLGIGLVALCFPALLLSGKGVPPEPAPAVWMREVGVLIVALSAILLRVRDQPDTPTMRALLWGNAVVHGGLLPIEILAWDGGVITRLDGIVPNSVLHVLFAAGFVFFARRASTRTA